MRVGSAICVAIMATCFLEGCASIPVAIKVASMVTTGVSYVTTGKGVADHVISATAGRDCAMHRALSGGNVCTTGVAAVADAVATGVATPQVLVAQTKTQASTHTNTWIEESAPSAAPRTPAIGESRSSAENTRRYLVIGSFRDPKNASERRERYRQYQATVSTTQTRNGTMYRVVIPTANADVAAIEASLGAGGITASWPMRLCSNSLQQRPCDSEVSPVVVATSP